MFEMIDERMSRSIGSVVNKVNDILLLQNFTVTMIVILDPLKPVLFLDNAHYELRYAKYFK